MLANRVGSGLTWYQQILTSREFYFAVLRSALFTTLALSIQVPLGIFIALQIPAAGRRSNLYIVLIAVPLLAPAILVGYIWKVLSLPQVGLLNVVANSLGMNFDMNREWVQTSMIQFDLGEGSAMSLVYLGLVICVSWLFFHNIVPPDR